MWYVKFCYEKIYPADILADNTQEVSDALNHMFKEYVEMHDKLGMKFNALEWWNVHQLKYPVLSKMARDVLAIPISTVASKETFSAGGRVIDPYRSALKSSTVEMLLCGGD
nr:zinc finger BED domain-containing protein RICESLEEPER 2-like [Tanacetum cinerariifolium]